MKLSNEEFFEISRGLEECHALFYSLWNMGKPIFTDDISTAAVCFDDEGEIVQFLFNPDLWNKLDNYSRKFIICHEILHVALNHGVRAKSAEAYEQRVCNIAMDLVVNHTLIDKFGFKRDKIQNAEKYCWVDKIFPRENIPTNWSFEHYYNKIMETAKEVIIKISGEVGTVDDHSKIGEQTSSATNTVIGELNNKLSNEEKQSLQDMVQQNYQKGEKGSHNKSSNGRSASGTGSWSFVDVGLVKKKRKWETIITKWAKKYTGYKDQEQWVRLNRRFTFMNGGIMLPTEMEVDSIEEGKISVFFFLDVSGSCYGYKKRFFKAALSLSKDRFDLRLFCFDTQVQETTLESRRIYGGGGTRFDIIEDHIQAVIKKEGCSYPDGVFVLTDLYGNRVNPQYPKKWYWFATQGISSWCKKYIPDKSTIVDLRDFE